MYGVFSADRRPLGRGPERTWVLGIFLIGVLLTVIVRVSILKGENYRALAQRYMVSVERQVDLRGERAAFVDRHGDLLVLDVQKYDVFAHPKRVVDIEPTVAALAPVLAVSSDELRVTLKANKHFIWLRRGVTRDVADRIRGLRLAEVGVQSRAVRFYPRGNFAGQVLGFVGTDGLGLEGLERFLDDKLRARVRTVPARRDVRGRRLYTEGIDKDDTSVREVVLSLDAHLQAVAQQAVDDAVERFGAQHGSAIALDPKTGEVLALVASPGFDPSRFQQYSPDRWRMRALVDSFEPGSVVKPFVLAAAIESGGVRLSDRFDVEGGVLQVGSDRIHDAHRDDELSAIGVIARSSNVGIYKIAQRAGRDAVESTLRGFGFGESTPLDPWPTPKTILRPAQRWKEITFANISFGQGLTSTVAQLGMAVGAIANGGLLMQPVLIKRFNYGENKTKVWHPIAVRRRAMRKRTAGMITESMVAATDPEGTAEAAAIDGVRVAAKTGTAQQVDPVTRRYDPEGWVALVMGFAPAEDPLIAVVVAVHRPTQGRYGGEVAAPAMRQVMFEALARAGKVSRVLPVAADDSRSSSAQGGEGGHVRLGPVGREGAQPVEDAQEGALGGSP